MRDTLIILLFGSLLAGCGGTGPRRGTGPGEPLDTLTYRNELDRAKDALRTGRNAEVERIVRPIVQAAQGAPPLRKQGFHALSMLGQVLQRRSQPDSALACYEQVLLNAELARDTFWIGAAWTNIGVAREIQGDYPGALQAGLNALRWKELLGDSLSIARVLHNMSVLQWRRDSMDQALAFLQRSLAIKRQLDPEAVASGLNGLGVLLIEAGRYDSALAVLRESLLLEDSLGEGADREMQISNIGLAYERAGELDSAVFHYQQSLREARAHGNSEVEVRALYGLGDVRRAQGRLQEALPLLDSSLAVATRIGSLEDMKEAHLSLATLHEKMADPEAALEHFRDYHALNDSLMNESTRGEMAELQLRFDTEHKDRENAALRAAEELASLRADRNRWTAIGIGVLAIAIAVSGWAMVQRSRQRAREREAELEQEALRLQMDPHFLFNALNTVPGLYAGGDVATANDHVAHLSRFLRLVLETSRRRTIPLQQEIQLVEHYLRISANRKPGSFSWELKVMPYVQAERIAVPPMLIQPVVENAIEHGFSGVVHGHLSILVDRAGGVLHVEVRDNGIGRSAAAKRPSRRNGTSLGMDLVRKRIALFDRATSLSEAVQVRDLKDDNGAAQGTVVTLRLRVIPLTEHAALGDR
ncbi:MAG: tetratricopeptide repeat protein [Flavobacteriales bacterium]|nr:tetratricopeptide repeat protein [Flavobacteriales bacterium]